MAMTDADDIRAIELLQRAFARCNDEGRWHDLAALFEEDGHLVRPSDPGHPIVGREAILQSFLARPAGAPRRHLVADPEVELMGGDAARACCRSILVVDQGEGRATVTVGGFVDQLRRTPQGWRFASRSGFTTVDPVACTLRAEPAACSFHPAFP